MKIDQASEEIAEVKNLDLVFRIENELSSDRWEGDCFGPSSENCQWGKSGQVVQA